MKHIGRGLISGVNPRLLLDNGLDNNIVILVRGAEVDHFRLFAATASTVASRLVSVIASLDCAHRGFSVVAIPLCSGRLGRGKRLSCLLLRRAALVIVVVVIVNGNHLERDTDMKTSSDENSTDRHYSTQHYYSP